MVSITPQGEIYLCKTPLENDYKNQLTFSNATAQNTYFTNAIFKTLDDYTYIKHDNIIKVGFNIDEIISCNYLFYKNEGFSNKWYYCFITNMEYVNENCTSISFETDVWQTYQFDISYKACFVEREHVNDDTFGKHTIPENLETGEYIIKNETDNTDLQDLCPVVSATIDPDNSNVYGSFVGNKYESLGYYIFKGGALVDHYDEGDQVNAISNYLQNMASNSKSDAIVSVFMAPKKLVGWSVGTVTWNAGSLISGYTWRNAMDVFEYETSGGATGYHYDRPITFSNLTTTRPTTFGSYTPHNNKLYVFPYSYMNLTNNNGSSAIYRYEDFSNNTPNFEITGIITPSCSIHATPLNYKSQLKAYNDGLQGAKYPICSWNNDVYTNWLTQQAVNIALDTTKNIANIVGGAVTGNVGGVASGLMGIFGTMSTVYQHSLIPPQAEGNINSGDVGNANKKITFTLQDIQIREEYARIIDRYFDMFGYKVNSVKIPNITGRTNWNFVKTIECNFEGDIPQLYLQQIKQIFNNGITLWHNPTTMYDYTQSNGIVS